jgi:zinc transporter 1/2/3
MEHNVTDDPIHTENDAEGIVTAKVVAMVVLSLASFILGMLPTQLSKWFRWNRTTDGGLNASKTSQLILSLLLCFGGGALLCTMFLHMLPEVRDIIVDLQGDGEIAETDFSLPELLMCCGFFIMYLVEELIHLYLHGHADSKGVSEADEVIHRSFSVRKCSGNKGSIENDTEDSQKGCEDTSSLKVLHGYPSALTISTLEDVESNGAVASDTKAVIPHHMPRFEEDDPIVSSVRGLLVVLALSVHELFEGLAVGLQTSTSYVWYMLGAVSSHKLVIAFCVGIELVSSRTKFVLTLVYISTFALVSPLGIGIGLGLSEGSGGDPHGGVANAVLQGIAIGTLLYVVFFEVLQRERNNNESGLLRLLAILVGFGAMFGLRIAGKVTSNCPLIHTSRTKVHLKYLQQFPCYTQDNI